MKEVTYRKRKEPGGVERCAYLLIRRAVPGLSASLAHQQVCPRGSEDPPACGLRKEPHNSKPLLACIASSACLICADSFSFIAEGLDPKSLTTGLCLKGSLLPHEASGLTCPICMVQTHTSAGADGCGAGRRGAPRQNASPPSSRSQAPEHRSPAHCPGRRGLRACLTEGSRLQAPVKTHA